MDMLMAMADILSWERFRQPVLHLQRDHPRIVIPTGSGAGRTECMKTNALFVMLNWHRKKQRRSSSDVTQTACGAVSMECTRMNALSATRKSPSRKRKPDMSIMNMEKA